MTLSCLIRPSLAIMACTGICLATNASAQNYGAPSNYAAQPSGYAQPGAQTPPQYLQPAPGSFRPAQQPVAGGRQIIPVAYADPGQNQPGQAPGQPVARVADLTGMSPIHRALTDPAVVKPGEHPLMPALRWAKTGVENIRKIQDYSATLVKRERIGNDLGEHEYMFIKVRHQPFSVYMYFLAPEAKKAQECIYVEGKNGGNMWGHANGVRNKLLGTLSLKPTGPIAMAGNRYPITQLGLLKLTERLIEVAEQDVKFGECEVKVLPGAKINDRICTCIQVVHPVPRQNFIFNMARIFVDDELNVPVRYEAYDWPKEAGGQPLLTEEYTYLNLKINNGFTDADFDIKNPNYQFK
jgi:hypothetical protein